MDFSHPDLELDRGGCLAKDLLLRQPDRVQHLATHHRVAHELSPKARPTHVNDFSEVRHGGISSESRTDEPPPTGISSRREIGANTARLCYPA